MYMTQTSPLPDPVDQPEFYQTIPTKRLLAWVVDVVLIGILTAIVIPFTLFIGLLIITYARFYLAKEDPMGRFMAYLLLFQGAMVGIVLSDNILLLLVFW